MSLLPLHDLVLSVAVIAIVILVGEYFWRKDK
jgi:hypothetical protein